MGSTSEQGGKIGFATSAFGENYPQDVFHARALLNNAQHFSDQDGQVRVCTSGFELTTTATPGDTSTWYPITRYQFPLRIDADGTAYPLRCRIAASRSSQAATVRVRVCVSSPLTALRDAVAGGANVVEVSTATTAHGWLTYNSNADGTTVLQVTRAQVDEALLAHPAQPTIDTSGNPTDVRMVQVVATVWGRTANTLAIPEFNGLYLAEFV